MNEASCLLVSTGEGNGFMATLVKKRDYAEVAGAYFFETVKKNIGGLIMNKYN